MASVSNLATVAKNVVVGGAKIVKAWCRTI